MQPLIGIHSLSKSFGTKQLFQGISFMVEQGDRIGLIGPNGSGKSTLMKILAGLEAQDAGSLSRRQGITIGYASQNPEFPSLSIERVLVEAAPLREEEHARVTRARVLLGKAQFTDFSQNAHHLSGGWKKRLDILRACASFPDLLLLDEPTNHLDLEGILWLEQFLNKERISYIIVSHDRYFLENVSNRVIEFNPCYPQGLFMAEGGIGEFLERKQQFLEGEKERQKGLASVVRGESAWLKTSPKARTTKSKSRIQAAYEMMEELEQLQKRNKGASCDFEFNASMRQTRKLLTAKNISKALGKKTLFKGLDITLTPGSRLGIVGKNGSGKTTLLKLLSGEICSDLGCIKYADDLKITYFDQHREKISDEVSLREALSESGDFVNWQGNKIHVNGWAKKFLFSQDRMELPVKCLSGGERARILIARLMQKPADVLFLDEPTNDLDIPTLEVIEESLKEFAGAVVLISHDRCLMDRVCTEVLCLEEDGHQFFADYSRIESSNLLSARKKEPVQKTNFEQKRERGKKLSYQEQKELDGMEKVILLVEEEIDLLTAQCDSNAFAADSQKNLEIYRQMAEAQKKLDFLFERWEFLQKKACNE